MPKIVAEHTDNDLLQVLDSGNPRGFEDAQEVIRLSGFQESLLAPLRQVVVCT